MFLEVAEIIVKSGLEAEFEKGVEKAVPLFAATKGCHGLDLQRSHENPARYLLFVRWETIENHTVDFRNSAAFAQWPACVAYCFDAPPKVEHMQLAVHGFGEGPY
jgi:quinol monooxygenase YgiN